jgi:hypothetical protein
MEDDELVEYVARDFIERYGAAAAGVLRERAERCDAEGDRPSAQTWLKIADAAEGLVSGARQDSSEADDDDKDEPTRR